MREHSLFCRYITSTFLGSFRSGLWLVIRGIGRGERTEEGVVDGLGKKEKEKEKKKSARRVPFPLLLFFLRHHI